MNQVHWLSTDYNTSGWFGGGLLISIALVAAVVTFFAVNAEDWSYNWTHHWRRNVLIAWLIVFGLGGDIWMYHYGYVTAATVHTMNWSEVDKLNINYWRITSQDGTKLTVQSNFNTRDLPPDQR